MRSKAKQTLPLYVDYGLASRVLWLHYAQPLPVVQRCRLPVDAFIATDLRPSAAVVAKAT